MNPGQQAVIDAMHAEAIGAETRRRGTDAVMPLGAAMPSAAANARLPFYTDDAGRAIGVDAATSGGYNARGAYQGSGLETKGQYGYPGDVSDVLAMNQPSEAQVGFSFLRDIPPDYHQRLAGGLPLGLDYVSQQRLRKRTENMIAKADEFNYMIEKNWGRMIGDLEVRKLYDPMAGELENQLIRWRKSAEQMRANFLESGKELQAIDLQMTEAGRRQTILGQYHQRIVDSMRTLGSESHLPHGAAAAEGGQVLDQLQKYITFAKTKFTAEQNPDLPPDVNNPYPPRHWR